MSPLRRADLRFRSPQPDISLHCKTTDTGLVHVSVYLFTSQPNLILIYQSRRDGRLSWWITNSIQKWLAFLVLHNQSYYVTPNSKSQRRYLNSMENGDFRPTRGLWNPKAIALKFGRIDYVRHATTNLTISRSKFIAEKTAWNIQKSPRITWQCCGKHTCLSAYLCNPIREW